ncbi:Na+/galactose cotransporter, partial [Saccharopolyspora elongata]
MAVLLAQGQLLDANAVDYALLALYFVFVLGIGYLARRAVSTSLDFFL